jgi:salicylate hydroxylase
MASSRTIVIVGAGIGGMTAALALARQGFRVALFDQAERLEETGAGIQLTPNATRILMELGLGQRLRQTVVTPTALQVRAARSGAEIVGVPLGQSAEVRYGTPYWVTHRADLQAALLDAVLHNPDVALTLGARVVDCAVHLNGVTVGGMRGTQSLDSQGIALVGADGLWSTVRTRLGDKAPPRPARHTAWRALVAADDVAPRWREPVVNLWLGPSSHLVHYPVKSGQLINVVAIVKDNWSGSGWSSPGRHEELQRLFPARDWSEDARTLLAAPPRWLKWSLADRPPLQNWGRGGPVTLLGDAAHPMLPFLAQGAAMAIEDAGVLADCLGNMPDDPTAAMRAYERERLPRVTKAQQHAQRTGRYYEMSGLPAVVRDLALGAMGGKRLLQRYDWIYRFRIGGRPDTKR